MKKILFVLLVISMLVFVGCSESNDKAASTDSEVKVSSDAVSDTPKEDTKEEEEPTPDPEATQEAEDDKAELLEIGEVSTLGDWSITVTGTEFTDKISTSEYTGFSAEEGNQYLVVAVTVENNGKEMKSFLPSFSLGDDIRTEVLYQDDIHFTASSMLGYDQDLHDSSLNPLSSKSGVVVFEMPTKAVETEESIKIVFSEGSKSVEYKIR